MASLALPILGSQISWAQNDGTNILAEMLNKKFTPEGIWYSVMDSKRFYGQGCQRHFEIAGRIWI